VGTQCSGAVWGLMRIWGSVGWRCGIGAAGGNCVPGGVVAVITSSGDVGLAGSVYEGQGTLSAPGGSLVFKNGVGEVVAYVSATGDLYLCGTVTSGP